MKKGFRIFFIVLAVLIVAFAAAFFWGVGVRNSMVKEQETVEKAWADVQTQYQRRADLIPNLVETVKGYAQHESQTLQNVIEARAKATSITLDPKNLTQENLQQYQQAQGELSSAIGRLLVSIERYPELKANQNFLDLQAQLEGTENRVNNARDNFNTLAQVYNTHIRLFPQSVVANMCGFQDKPYFQASEKAQEAPEVKF